MPMKPSDVEVLIELFEASDWQEMHLEYQGEELFLSKSADAVGLQTGAAAIGPSPAPPTHASASLDAPGRAHTPSPNGTIDPDRTGWEPLKAANLGTFYRAPNPEAPPYVREGSAVTPDSEVCLIEVMKLFTTIRAGLSGTVREIVASDGEMVEYGAVLMWIEPNA